MSNKEVKKKVPKSMTFVAASKSSHIARRCSHNVTVRRVAEMPTGSRHATSLKDRPVSVILNSEASNMMSLATDGSDQGDKTILSAAGEPLDMIWEAPASMVDFRRSPVCGISQENSNRIKW